MLITSRRNLTIRRLRNLLRSPRTRREARLFAAEGARVVAEALRAGWQPVELLVRHPPLSPAQSDVLSQQPAVSSTPVAADVLDWAIDADAAVDVVAIFELPQETPLDPVMKSPTAVLVAEDIQDPRNVGALLRVADGAGLDAVVLLGQSADPFGPKAVRGSAGAVFTIPIYTADTFSDIDWHGLGLTTIASAVGADVSCFSLDLRRSVALVFGNEAHGLRPETFAACDERARVPMAGQLASLNVATAAAIFAYECARQQGRILP